jgi:hypothetical protein
MTALPIEDAHEEVWGGDCKNGHFNDPRAQYCWVCGIGMAQQSLLYRTGPRPALGLLLIDDGSMLRLDTDYILGRRPADIPGRAKAITIDEDSISRRHLQVRLNGWNVELMDLASVNGTHVRYPGYAAYVRIEANQPVRILPGTMVRLGTTRTFRYESQRRH